jgi:hypothetical protein
VLLAVAWCFAITMLLVIPDIRLLQNLAYGLLFVFVKLDWPVLNQGLIVLGGIFWAMTAISYRRKHAGAGTGRREAKVAANRSPALMRWAKAATYAAFLLPLPYGITRLAWGGDLAPQGPLPRRSASPRRPSDHPRWSGRAGDHGGRDRLRPARAHRRPGAGARAG